MQNFKAPSRPVRRGGIALIEMVSLITVIGVLLSLSAIVLNQAYRVHANGLVQLRQMQQLNLWADRFRNDAHQSTEVVISDGILFDRENQSDVRYTLEDASIVRRTQSGEQTLSVERWDLPPVTTAEWDVETSGRLPLVSLRLAFAPSQVQMEPLNWVARVGSERTQLLPPLKAGDSNRGLKSETGTVGDERAP
jgi:hypothetical protein